MNFIIHQIEMLVYPVLTNYTECIVETCSERNYEAKPLRVGLQSSVRTFGFHRRASRPQQTCKGPQAVAARWSSPAPQCIAVALGRQPRHAQRQKLGCLSAGVGMKQWKENIG